MNISNIALSQMALATIMSMNFDFDDTFFVYVVCDDINPQYVAIFYRLPFKLRRFSIHCE